MSQKYQQKLQKQQKKKKQQQKQKAKASAQKLNTLGDTQFIQSNVSLEDATYLATKYVDFVAGVHLYISSKERDELLAKIFVPLTKYIGKNLSGDMVERFCDFLDFAKKTATELDMPHATMGITPTTAEEREMAAKALLLRQMLEDNPDSVGLLLNKCSVEITQTCTGPDSIGHFLYRFPAGDMRDISISTYDGMVIYKTEGDEKYGCALSSSAVSSLRLHGALVASALNEEVGPSEVTFDFDAP